MFARIFPAVRAAPWRRARKNQEPWAEAPAATPRPLPAKICRASSNTPANRRGAVHPLEELRKRRARGGERAGERSWLFVLRSSRRGRDGCCGKREAVLCERRAPGFTFHKIQKGAGSIFVCG